MRYTTPKKRIEDEKREVSIVYLGNPRGDFALNCKLPPKKIEAAVALLVKHGCAILSIDGVKPPKGSNGTCFYDGQNEGPYWMSDL